MKNMKRYLQTIAMMILAAGATVLTGCGEDDPVTPPDYGESSVTFLHANPGRPSGVGFYRNDSTQVGSGTTVYEGFFTATTPNGPSVKYTVKSGSGEALRSVSGAQDTVKNTMVVYTGSATTDSLFMASSTWTEPGTNAAVRFIHASQGAGARDLRMGAPGGAAIAQNLRYKQANGSYITVPIATDTLWIVDPSDAANNVAVPINLMAGRGYSIVFIGTENPVDPQFAWKGLIIADPN